MGRPLGSKNKKTISKEQSQLPKTQKSLESNMKTLIASSDKEEAFESYTPKKTGERITNWVDDKVPSIWDRWGKWKLKPVSDKSEEFINWMYDVQDIVNTKYPGETHNIDYEFEKKFIRIFVVDPKGRQRVFAFIGLKTGDIHTPFKSQDGSEWPLDDCFSGNIFDPDFRTINLTPTGVKVNERWMTHMPTHPEYIMKHYGD